MLSFSSEFTDNGNALLRKDGETPLFDGLGSERTVTNGSGASSASLTLSAFGGTVASSGTTASAYNFGATSGYQDDGDAGLVKVGCRYYAPEVGRFTSRDTDLSRKPCGGHAQLDTKSLEGVAWNQHDFHMKETPWQT